MADRTLNDTAVIYATLQPAREVHVTVTNPYGSITVLDELATEVRTGRYMVDIGIVDVPGVWTARWYDGVSGRVTQHFTVGTQPLAGMSVFDVRAQVSARVENKTHLGSVGEVSGDTFIDETVQGGSGSFGSWWIIVDEGGLTKPRRVKSYSGSGFTVAPGFETPPMPGTRYILTDVSPFMVDAAIKTALSEVSETARIEEVFLAATMTAGGDVGTAISIPAGITHVHMVRVNDIASPRASWNMAPGRRLFVATDMSTAGAEVRGIRPAGHPQWEDSIVDYEPGAIIARVASIVHAGRAGGQGADIDENLRRQLAALDEYMELRGRSVGRPYPGQMRVVD